jgi:hypothetical protein
MEGHKIQKCPGGETGRHIGLKIRRLPEKGRAGSIPAPGTNTLFYIVSNPLKTRMPYSRAGFLLSQAIASPNRKYQQIDAISIGAL